MAYDYNWIIYLINIFLVYFVIVYFLWRTKALEKYHISIWGPIIMWRTQGGKRLIERLSKARRFWNIYASISIALVLSLMVMMVVLLLQTAYFVTLHPEVRALEATEVLALPGINPMIPFWFGIIGLVIAIIVHEFAHGILARVGEIKLKSLGLLVCVVPIGAFVEPDEEQLLSTTKLKRSRVFAVGPSSNIVIAFVFAAILSWSMIGSIEPKVDGVFIESVTEESPAGTWNITPGAVITHLEEVGNASNSLAIRSYNDFHEFLKRIPAGALVNATVYDRGKTLHYGPIILDNRMNYTKQDADNGTGFLGVRTNQYSLRELRDMLQHPITSAKNSLEALMNAVNYGAVLPMTGTIPFHSPLSDYYEVRGGWGVLPGPVFWFIANSFYYLFWLNLLVGTFNVLPAVPLDGGHIFKDAVAWVVEKVRKNLSAAKKELVVRAVSRSIAFAILFLILWELLIPRLI